MANTLSIAAGSVTNSVGTYLYTNGQTSISISLGGISYDFTNGQLCYLGKKGNSLLENVEYFFGAMSNISDIVSAFRGGGKSIKVNSAKTKGVDEQGHQREWWGHSSITGDQEESLLSVGPDSQIYKTDNLAETWHNSIKGANLNWQTYVGEQGTWSIELNNISVEAINKYASGVTRWDLLLNSCVGHTTRSLWAAGVPVLYAFHPHMLNVQLLIRQLGIYSSPFIYQIP